MSDTPKKTEVKFEQGTPTPAPKPVEKKLEVYKPVGIAPAEPSTSAENTATILAAREKALVEARYIVAMRQPRVIEQVRANLLHECERPSFAAVARYHKPIGKGIEGPSIRFAEAAIQAMGNITVETPTIDEDETRRVMRVTVTDIERNASYSQDIIVQKSVERRAAKDGDYVLRSRTNSRGETVYLIAATDDDVLNKQNALVSKAIRTLGLRLIPGWLVDECMAMVLKTNESETAKNPDAAKHSLLDKFMMIGVTPEQIAEYLGHDLTVIQPKEYETLRGIGMAIRDGEATWAEVVEAKAKGENPITPSRTDGTITQKGTASLKSALADKIPAPASPGSGGSAKPAESGEKK